MRRLLALMSLCLAATLSLHGQTATLQGRVLSASDSSAMIGVTIMMQDNNQINAATDYAGRFTLVNVPYGDKVVEVLLLGYDKMSVPVRVSSSSVDIRNVWMRETQNQIGEIMVRAQAPIAVMKGDTVEYNAEAFKVNPDADVEELITKMPGITVEDGNIEAHGEPVRRVYVDGKLFFGNDPMVAIKSLPADAVESIQVFDVQSEMARLTGLYDGETEKAINIVTKAKYRKSTILKVEAAAGAETDGGDVSRYLFGGNVSRFTPVHRLTATWLSNNVNQAKFGQSDRSALDDNMNSNSMGVQVIDGGGINYAFQKDAVKLETDYVFGRNENTTSRALYREFNPNDITSATAKGTVQRYYWNWSDYIYDNYHHNGSLRLSVNAGPKNSFVLSARGAYGGNSTDPRGDGERSLSTRIYDSLVTETQTRYVVNDSINRNGMSNSSATGNFSVSGELLYSRRFEKKGRSFTVAFNYGASEREYDRYRKDAYFDTYATRKVNRQTERYWKPRAEKDLTNNYTRQTSESDSYGLRVALIEPITERQRISLNYSFKHEWGDFDQRLKRYHPDWQDYHIPNFSQYSIYSRIYNTNSFGASYVLYTTRLALNAGVNLQRLDQLRDQEMPVMAGAMFTFHKWEPNFSLKYSIQKPAVKVAAVPGDAQVGAEAERTDRIMETARTGQTPSGAPADTSSHRQYRQPAPDGRSQVQPQVRTSQSASQQRGGQASSSAGASRGSGSSGSGGQYSRQGSSSQSSRPSSSSRTPMKKSYLKLQYKGRTEIPRIDQMQNVVDISNLMYLKKGNPNIKDSYRHSVELLYNSVNPVKSSNFNLSVKANNMSDYIATTVTEADSTIILPSGEEFTVTPGATITMLSNLDGFYAYDAASSYSRYVKPLKCNLNLGLSYSYNRTPSYNKVVNYSDVNVWRGRIGLASNISQNVDFNVYDNITYRSTVNSARKNNDSHLLDNRLYGSLNIIFLKRIVFNTVAVWRKYDVSGNMARSESSLYNNVSLACKFLYRNAAEVRLTVYDLWGRNSNHTNQVRPGYTEDIVANTIQRYYMLRFSFKFNSMMRPAKIPGAVESKNMSVKEFQKSESKK